MIPISPQQDALLNLLRRYSCRPLPSRAVLARQLGSTAHRVTSSISVLRKRGIIKITGHRLAQIVEIMAKTYVPAEHAKPEPEKITRDSRRACLSFVTGHQPWQIDLGARE